MLLDRPTQVAHQVVGGGEVRGVSRLDRLDRQSDAQVRLAHAWWTEEDHVAAIVEEAQRLHLAYLALVDTGLESEVELVQRLDDRKTRHTGACLQQALAPRGSLAFQKLSEELRIGHLLLGGPFQVGIQDRLHISESERVEQLGKTLCNHDASPSSTCPSSASA